MKNPYQVIELTYELAHKKSNYTLPRILTLSALAGAYLGMGATLSLLMAYGFNGAAEFNPVIPKLMMGLSFPLGLALIMIVGAELFTGNTATLIPSLLLKRVTPAQVVRNLTLVWIGNFIGTLFFGYLFVHLTGLLGYDPWREGLEGLAIAKCSNSFLVTMLKGIVKKLVCVSVIWMFYAGESLADKLIDVVTNQYFVDGV